MSSNVIRTRDYLPPGLVVDDEGLLAGILGDLPPDPCELLEPVMRGIMAKELAGMVFPGKEDDLERKDLT